MKRKAATTTTRISRWCQTPRRGRRRTPPPTTAAPRRRIRRTRRREQTQKKSLSRSRRRASTTRLALPSSISRSRRAMYLPMIIPPRILRYPRRFSLSHSHSLMAELCAGDESGRIGNEEASGFLQIIEEREIRKCGGEKEAVRIYFVVCCNK